MAASSPAAWILLFIAVGIAAAPSSSASLLPPGVDYFSCWGTFSSVVGCSAKVVVPAPGSVQLLLSPACCKFAVEVERTCFLGTFRNFPYASGADEFVRRICGSSAGLPPATAPAPAPALNA